MVQECMTFLDATPDVDTKVALAKTLVTVSAGKARGARNAAPNRALLQRRCASFAPSADA